MTSGSLHPILRTALIPVALAATVLVPPRLASAQAPISIHAQELAEHAGAPTLLSHDLPPPQASRKTYATFTRTVYGYLPYWTTDVSTVPWDHLTHLSYFGVTVNQDGTLGTDYDWSTKGAQLVATGHAHNVKVTLTAILFDGTKIGNLLATDATRTKTVQNLLARVQAQGGDGINIDFEFVPKSAKANFVTFINQLSAAFHTAIPGSHVSIATPSVDYSGAYDYDLLAEGCDGLMIMAYGYHWPGGNPGPLSPIDSGTTWGSRSLRWTVNDYLTWGEAANRQKFVLGFPLYGHNWPTTASAVPGTRHADLDLDPAPVTVSSPNLSSCDTSFLTSKSWDEDSQTPYRVYESGGYWHQLFCEDTDSLAAKLDLVNEVDVGGAMFWAIGKVSAAHAVWSLVDQRFKVVHENVPPVAVARVPASANAGDTLTLDATGSSDPDGDPLTFAWTAVSGPIATIDGGATDTAHVVVATAGTYAFRLRVADGEATTTAEASVLVMPVVPPDDGGPGPQADGGPLPGDDDQGGSGDTDTDTDTAGGADTDPAGDPGTADVDTPPLGDSGGGEARDDDSVPPSDSIDDKRDRLPERTCAAVPPSLLLTVAGLFALLSLARRRR